MMIIENSSQGGWGARFKNAFNARNRPRTLKLGIIVLAALAVPVTLYQVSQVQNFLQQAAGTEGTIVVNPGRWLRIGPILTGTDAEDDTNYIQFSKASTLNLPLQGTNVTPPVGAIFVSPSGNNNTGNGSESAPYLTLRKAINSSTAGSTIVLREGTYKEGNLVINKKLTVQAYPGEKVWLDGSNILPPSEFQQDGNLWKKIGITIIKTAAGVPVGQEADAHWVDEAYPMSGYPEAIFYNGTPLLQVSSKERVRPGSFYIDYSTATLYMADNPTATGAIVEEISLPNALTVRSTDASESIIRGLGFKKYAPSLFDYMVAVSNTTKVKVENNTFAWSSGTGATIGRCNDCVVNNNISIFNGFQGFSGGASERLRFEKNYMAFNNFERTNPWGAAGIKMAIQTDATFADNVAEYNLAQGFWCDISCMNTRYIRNTARQNTEAGIMYEISHGGFIASNLLVGNESGLLLSGASGVQIYNNTSTKNFLNFWLRDQQRDNVRDATNPPNDWHLHDIVLRNNILSQGPKAAESKLMQVLSSQKPAADLVNSDYNAFYRNNVNSPELVAQYNGASRTLQPQLYKTLQEVSAGVQEEMHSIMPDPSLTNPFFPNSWTHTLIAGSPALTSGTNIPSVIATALGVSATNTKQGILHTPVQLQNARTFDETRQDIPSTPTVPEGDIVTKQIFVTEDAYVDPSKPSQNFGTDDMLLSGNTSNKISFVKFNIEELKNKKVVSAVFHGQLSTQSDRNVSIKVAANNWTESTITAQNQPTINPKRISFGKGSYPRQAAAYNVIDAVLNAVQNGRNEITLAILPEEDPTATSTTPATEEWGIYSKDSTGIVPRTGKPVLFIGVEEDTSCPYLPTYLGHAETTISVTKSGNYRVWSNIRSNGNFGNSFWIQLDDDPCKVARVGDSSEITHNAWQWVDYKNGNKNEKINLNLTEGTHILSIRGREPGLQLGRVLLTEEFAGGNTCMPVDNGDNCIVGSTQPSDTPIPPTNTPTLTPTVTKIPTKTPTPTPITPTLVVKSYTITGRVYYDANNNGRFDLNTDSVMRNSVVATSISDNSSILSNSTTTSSTGQYTLTVSSPGSYRVSVRPPEGYYTFTAPVVTVSATQVSAVADFPLKRGAPNQ